jgi:hypothetical protein
LSIFLLTILYTLVTFSMDSNTPQKSILLLAANPKRTKGLRLQEEEREIKERLRLAGYGKTPINATGATRPRDIQQAMLDFKPQIVHFSGHGAEQEGLVFEDVTGQEKLVSSEALANLFRLFSDRVECVVLNACYSKFQAEAIAQHIEYVIGMNQGIGDNAAIEFSVGFYSALGARETIEFAYELGCSAIQLEGFQEELTPVLYKQGKLLQIYIGNRFSQTNSPPEVPVKTTFSFLSDPSPQYPEKQGLHDNRDEIALALINKLFDVLRAELDVRQFEEIAHRSLFKNGQVATDFRNNSLNVALSRANLYKQPPAIINKQSTGRTRLGLRSDKEDGQEEKYTIARCDRVGGLEGCVRIFFPADGGIPKISGLSL